MIKNKFFFITVLLIFVFLFIPNCIWKKVSEKKNLTEYFQHYPIIAEKNSISFNQDDFYSIASIGWSKSAQKPNSPFFLATGPDSTLRLLFSERKDYRMKLTCTGNASYKMRIDLNEKPVSTLQVKKGKNIHRTTLLKENLKVGMNELRFSFSPTDINQKNKIRIVFRRIDFSPVLNNKKPGIKIFPEDNIVRLTGPLCCFYFIKTGRNSRLRFNLYSNGQSLRPSVLRITAENFLGEKTHQEIPLTNKERKKATFDLTMWTNQIVKVSFQHLAPDDRVTEIQSPVLEAAAYASEKRKILLIGLDGADWNDINPLLKKGKLPNFNKLITSGVSGSLLTVRPMYSPVIWTSIATGKKMEKHGIMGFLEQQRKKGEIIPNSRLSRKCQAVWNILSNYGYTIGLTGPWVTWPAETVNGFVLTDRMYFENMVFTTFPSELKSQLYLRIIPFVEKQQNPAYLSMKTILEFPDLPLRSTLKDNIKNESMYIRQDNLKSFAGLFFNQIFHPDFSFIYMRGPDVTSHFFRKYFEPDSSVSEDEVRAFADLIPRNYFFQDYVIGRYLEEYGPDITTIIVSDHGMGKKSYNPEVTFTHIKALWNDLGITDSVSHTGIKAHQVELTVKNRSNPAELKAKLESIKLGNKGIQLFNVTQQGNKNSLLLEVCDFPYFDSELSLKSNGKSLGTLGSYANLREISGAHTPHGILIMHGAGIKKNQKLETCSVLDITPTLLHLMGLPIGKDMDGRVLTEAFTSVFINKNPIEQIDSYEILSENISGKNKLAPRDKELESKLLDRLRSLGYIK